MKNRSIKFKVVNPSIGEVFGYERFSPTNGWTYCLTWETQDSPTWRPGVISGKMDAPFKRLQYTGLVDNNNNQIYDHDIILTPLDHVCLIKWGHVSMVFEDDRFEYTGFVAEHSGHNYHLDRTICDGEIIGNKIITPNLLED